MNFVERFVQRDQYRIYSREYPGEEPAIILMHGFPDNLHLYDRVLPFLSPRRRVVTFDFLGWGNSDKPQGYVYTTRNQEGDLEAVIKQLQLETVVLVAHDTTMARIERFLWRRLDRRGWENHWHDECGVSSR